MASYPHAESFVLSFSKMAMELGSTTRRTVKPAVSVGDNFRRFQKRSRIPQTYAQPSPPVDSTNAGMSLALKEAPPPPVQ